MLSTHNTIGSPAQKQWLFKCCRPNYMAKPTSVSTPGRLFFPIQNRWKDTPGVRERTFPWISFTAYHQVCPFQKPSPNHFKTGTPSRLQIPPKTSASGCFCHGSPKSLKSHVSYIKTGTDPKINKVLHDFFPKAELNIRLKFSFLPNHMTFFQALLKKKRKNSKLLQKDHLTGPHPYSQVYQWLVSLSKQQEPGTRSLSINKKVNTGGKVIEVKSTNVLCLCATVIHFSTCCPCPLPIKWQQGDKLVRVRYT